ncbi:hypothetical protein ROZALSC1DRAFT_27064 [Rozella allomycis CSF55]|uniref:Cytochrome b-c1 complex subunit 8 n=1 Tax=Rozella allomycis (strain CSF55) TaxID=988480 RepID=A0A075AZU9_ROZAC|nr:hypothetical protein O9G_002637 [Rozella allomycis CSF55]RKP21529.1 hypothetical protein ROZALSC1DRAFT_27064 [Rozella allomycis CSF55]|eukprot:EPZ35629.1 hypothetical protein O9G_002637 [Rozella allomycis CSF55]
MGGDTHNKFYGWWNLPERGLYTYSISPFHLRVFHPYNNKKDMIKFFKAAKKFSFRQLPWICLYFLTVEGLKKIEHELHRKDPKEFENDE